MDLRELKIDASWTLFLDRDGVINEKLDGDYVKKIEEFQFLPGVLEAMPILRKRFGRIVIVTNQQGIGKGIMTAGDLKKVHDYMEEELKKVKVALDGIYYCPELAEKNAPCRKPNTGMAIEARHDFPEIDFEKSIMVGDSLSDMQMGRRAGMYTVFIQDEQHTELADKVCVSLKEFQELLGD